MRVLIFGMNGQLGKSLRQALDDKGILFVGVSSAVCDLTAEDQIEKAINIAQPDCVVNAAAYTQVALAEKNEEQAFQVNSKAPEILARKCAERDILLIHFSTDYVFDGTSSTPYTEEDEPNPLSVYGRTKLEGERMVQQFANAFWIIRVSWLYDMTSPNFVNTMRRLMKERGQVQVVDDQVASPTSAEVLAEDLAYMLDTYDRGKNQNGIYHYSHKGSCSWFEFAKLINEEFDLGAEVVPVDSSLFNDGVKRPKYSKLAAEKIEKRFALKEITWKEAFRKTLKEHGRK